MGVVSRLRQAAVDAVKTWPLPLTELRLLRLRMRSSAVLNDWRAPLRRGCAGRSWEEIRAQAQARPVARVQIATTVGANLATIQFDALMAVALTLRGAQVSFVLCDAALPACMLAQHDWYASGDRFAKSGPQRNLCRYCAPTGEAYLAPLGLPIRRLSEHVDPDTSAEIDHVSRQAHWGDANALTFRGIPVGEHALAGALRFFARGDLEDVPAGNAVFLAYLRAACRTVAAALNLSRDDGADVVLAHHGIYVPQGLWVEVARAAGQRVVTWNPGYRRNTFILSEGDTYHRTMISEDVAMWESLQLTPDRDAALQAYLSSRRTGSGDWISFGSGASGEFEASIEGLGLDPAKPTVLALTSVTWDAQLHYESNAFASQYAWLDHTLDWFKQRPDLNLVVRIHPAELSGNIRSRQPMADHIRDKHGALPPNIAVVGPDNPMNTYALADGSDCALIYSTKTGIELAAQGVPIIVAGEAWIRNKGFAYDAASPDDYLTLLEKLPFGNRIPPEKQARARRYAWHFFFRRMIALPGFVSRKGWPPYAVDVGDLAMLAPGADRNLDAICNSLLRSGPFLSNSDDISLLVT